MTWSVASGGHRSVKGSETHRGLRKRFRISITGIPALMRPLIANSKDEEGR
jgi:hypothetical protein